MDNGFEKSAEEAAPVEGGDAPADGGAAQEPAQTGLQSHHILGILVLIAAAAYVVATVLLSENKEDDAKSSHTDNRKDGKNGKTGNKKRK